MTSPAEEDRGPRVAIFPPVLFGLTLLVAILLQWAWPLRFWPAGWARWGTGGFLLLLAGTVASWGEREMHRAGTNVRPDRPSTALVEGGPFQYSRNPLYVSVNLLLAAVAVLANAGWFLLLLIPMDLVLHFGVVLREERYLEAKFGEPYRAYRSRVRRYF